MIRRELKHFSNAVLLLLTFTSNKAADTPFNQRDGFRYPSGTDTDVKYWGTVEHASKRWLSAEVDKSKFDMFS